MPIATPEIYVDMLDRAKKGAFAYPAINVSSSQTIIAAIRGFAEAESDGIIQFSWGGAEYASGSTVKKMVDGAVAFALQAAHRLLRRPSAAPHPLRTARHLDGAVGDLADGRRLQAHKPRSPGRHPHEDARPSRAGETRPQAGIHPGTPGRTGALSWRG